MSKENTPTPQQTKNKNKNKTKQNQKTEVKWIKNCIIEIWLVYVVLGEYTNETNGHLSQLFKSTFL